MGIIMRQSLKSTVVTMISAVLGGINTLLLMYLLSKHVFGLYSLTVSYGMFTSEVMLVLSQVLYLIFIKKYQDTPKEGSFTRRLFRVNFQIISLIAVIGLIYMLLIRDRLYFEPQTILWYLSEYLPYFLALSLVMAMYYFLTTVLAAKHKNTLSAIAKDFIPRVLNLAWILLAWLGVIDYGTLVILLLLQYLVGVLVAIFYIKKYKLLTLKPGTELSRDDQKEISNYRWTHIPFSLIWMLSMTSVSLVYTWFFKDGESTFAVFSISMFIINFMNIPYDQLSRASLSTLSQSMRNKQWVKLDDIYKRANLNLMHTGTFMAIWLLAAIPFLIFFTGTKYAMLLSIAPIFVAGKWVDMSTGFSAELIISSDRLISIVWLSLVSLLFMVLCYAMLIPLYGHIGVAMSMALWYVFFNIAKMLYVRSAFGLSPFMPKVFGQSLLFCVPILLLQAAAIHVWPGPIAAMISALVLSTVLVMIIYRRGYNQDAIKIAQKIFRL